MKRTLCAPTLAFTFALSGVALAQDPPPATAQAGGQVELGAGASGGGAMGLPQNEPQQAPAPAAAAPAPAAAAPAPAAAPAAAGGSDHDQMVGRVAVGYFGVRGVQVDCVGGNPNCGGDGTEVVPAPIVGIRYWIDPMLGIDVGLGIGILSVSEDVDPGDDPEQPKSNAFVLHGGVPLSLASSGHFSFQIVPELNVGFGNYNLDQPGDDFEGSGFMLEIGARAGAEIHFGFIGVPQLALQGSIGAGFALRSHTAQVGDAKDKVTTTSFGTSVQDNPWNIFTSNVAALYYF